jgi:hypothetical protein
MEKPLFVESKTSNLDKFGITLLPRKAYYLVKQKHGRSWWISPYTLPLRLGPSAGKGVRDAALELVAAPAAA